jgi:hypothetical protein
MLSASGIDVLPHEYIESGQTTIIQAGPLKGMQVFAVARNGVVDGCSFVKTFHSMRQACMIRLALSDHWTQAVTAV